MTTSSIPKDFPSQTNIAALSGVQPKLAAHRDAQSGLYFTGLTEEELLERYEVCVDLVQQIVSKCRRNRNTKYASMTETEILTLLFSKLIKTNWGTHEEMAWVIRHISLTLDWPPLNTAEKYLVPR